MENITTQKALKEKIRQKLKEKGMSINDLAENLGITYRYLYEVLSGYTISKPVMEQVAEFLNSPDLLNEYKQILAYKSQRQKQLRKATAERGEK